MNDRVAIIAVLSWTRGNGGVITQREQDYYGPGFPFLYGGPITSFAPATPTSVVFDKTGKAVAWRSGPLDWTSREVRVLMEALINQRVPRD